MCAEKPTTTEVNILLQMDAAVSIVLEGFTEDERKRREHALNTIMTLLAIETIALRKTLEELKDLKVAEIVAAMNRQ